MGNVGVLPVVNVKETGVNIRRLIDESGMKVRDVQNVFGFCSPQAIYKWIRGECMPTIDNLVILSAIFGVGLDEIVVVDNANERCA